VIVIINLMLEPVLTTHLRINRFITSKAIRAQKVVSARTMNRMIPVVINSIFLQILLASILCSSRARIGAFLLLLAAIVLVLR
jgi:hypothetical protein